MTDFYKSFEKVLEGKSKGGVVCGDCLDILPQVPDESVDLTYIDPPFYSDSNYRTRDGNEAFTDRWTSLDEYLDWLLERISVMRPILKRTGLIYIHLDHHACHEAKPLFDQVFGNENLRNEIIWYYNSAPRKKKDFGRRHDTIFRYSISEDYFFDDRWPPIRQPYSVKTSIPKSKAHYYDPDGKVIDDVWIVPIIGQADKTERTGYPTQKPEALLERIVGSSCPEDGIVADFFCGSGTTFVVAERLGRRWFGCDVNPEAIKITKERIEKERARYPLF
ncbi:MAG: site-specific DNA-methyltransferase [Deltaproteobacteria bacterium]|nr:site-specific DNA-methyltransferase [Deltaproteobacteria bacterium]